MSKFRTKICPQGHDKDVLGRTKSGRCKECKRLYLIEYTKKNNEKIKIRTKQWSEKNKEIIIAKRKENYQKTKEKRKEYARINRERIKKYQQEYQRIHKEKIRKQKQEYYDKCLEQDLNFKLSVKLRHRLRQAIKNNYKAGSAVQDLGCSIEFFKDYIAAKFYGGMTWDNYGEIWELDHIKELWEFDLNDREQFLKAVHYTNLQPLTIPDHVKKTAINAKLRWGKLPKS